LQMRVDMGVLQMEVDRRPDGFRPHGAETYFDYLISQVIQEGDDFVLSQEQCAAADREFVQYYHRRICWLALREFRRAMKDADHTLAFMDFIKKHSPEEDWTVSHEQYRPFVLFHRAQAAALAELEDHGPEAAINEIKLALEQFRKVFEEYEVPEKYDEDELVRRLTELQDTLREHYRVGRTLNEQLAEAVASEQYELAAQLRDEIARRQMRG
ncbi:MAG TPA: UvrB/UvrC motif-containing protein, partial [Pirellulales bacterium]